MRSSDGSNAGRSRDQERTTITGGLHLHLRLLLAAVCVLMVAVLPAIAFGDDATSPSELSASFLNDAPDTQAALEAQLTDSQAAEELPHRDLGREEAVELTEAVFEPELQSPAGIFDDLNVDNFLSDNAAITTAGAQDEAGAVIAGGGPEPEGDNSGADEAVLLESTLPLRTDGLDGKKEAVDLSLQHVDDELQPTNPLVEVGIPSQLGDGIELPDAGVQIELADAPAERTPSVIGGSVASYPNVATDTDFTVAPTPTGLETLTTLRSPSSPLSETLRLDLPAGANLVEDDGGAEVVKGGAPILRVFPPTAIDANGASVPVELTTNGDTMTVIAAPDDEAAWPILVDPVIETYSWYGTGTYTNWTQWHPLSNKAAMPASVGTNFGGAFQGIYVSALPATYAFNDQTTFDYYVPRLFEEEPLGKYPTSFIVGMTLSHVYFGTSGGTSSPYLVNGIWDKTLNKWAGTAPHEAVGAYQGNLLWLSNATWKFENGEPGKRDKDAHWGVGLGLLSNEATTLGSAREAYLGAATVEVGDEDKPEAPSGSVSEWVNDKAPEPLWGKGTDSGLGVKRIWFAIPGFGTPVSVNPCLGTAGDPCPSTWTAAQSFNPAVMPQGFDWVPIVAEDVLGNVSEYGKTQALVKVDHTAPQVALSGTLTEQAKLGTNLPQYTLKYAATDGIENTAPQSGVVSTEVKVDGKAVEAKYSPGCSTNSCAINRTWTLSASSYPTGEHTIEVTATDGVKLVTTEKLKINLTKDATAPQITATGPFFTRPEGWMEQKSYVAAPSATDTGGSGVTSLIFKVDGAAVQTVTQSCPNGGCKASFLKTMNMALYDGGTHTAEVVATDWSGNKASKSWTINVDPSGTINSEESTDTLEAFEETVKEAQPVAPTDEFLERQIIDAGDDPGLVNSNGDLKSTGVPTSTSIDGSTGVVTIEGAEGPIELTPVSAPPAAPAEVEAGVAAVGPSGALGVDTVARPEYNGLLLFTAIREPTSPESFTWHVTLQPGQKLVPRDEHYAEVVFEDGTEMALITAEPAHDATGAEVPTHIEISGSNVTLVVSHKAKTYVYPVLAGQAYETGYSTVTMETPSTPSSEPFQAEGEAAYANLPPMNQEELDDASASSAGMLPPPHRDKDKPVHIKEARHILKSGHLDPGATQSIGGPGPSGDEREHSEGYEAELCASFPSCSTWSMTLKGRYWRKTNYAEVDDANYKVHCEANVVWWWSVNLSNSVDSCGHRGVTKVKRGSGDHLVFYVQFHLDILTVPEIQDPQILSRGYELIEWVFPNGYSVQHWRLWNDPDKPEEA